METVHHTEHDAHQPHQPQHPQHDDHGGPEAHGSNCGHGSGDDEEAIRMLVDGAETMMPLFDQALAMVQGCITRRDLTVRRVVDVGAGPGVGTTALAYAFPDADVVAADASEHMLAAAAKRFAETSNARLSTTNVDLSGELATLGIADLIWASLVLHHVGDETSTMRKLGDLLTPKGLLVVVEFGNDLRILPPDGGSEGRFIQRLIAAGKGWIADMRAALPGAVVSGGYPTMIAAAGLQLLDQRLVEIDIEPPMDDAARRVVLAHLVRMRPLVAERMSSVDLAALDVLIDPDDPCGVAQRDDLRLSDSRWVYVAAKPDAEMTR